MREKLPILLNIAVLVFAISSMLSVGFGHTLREIAGPLRNVQIVFRALVGNFLLVPLLAYIILWILPLDRSPAIGLFLVASAAGSPFLIKLVETAESGIALSATLLVVLLPATILYMPIVVPLAVPDAAISEGTIAMPLVLTMLLPLGIGLLIRTFAEWLALRLLPLMGKTSSVALLVLIASTILLNVRGIQRIFGTGAILAAIILIGGAFGIGYLLAGSDPVVQEVLGLGTECGNAGVLEHDGSVYSCDHYVFPENRLGGIGEKSLAELMSSDRQKRFGQRKSEGLTSECRKCQYLFLCHGECPKNRFADSPSGERGHNYLCEGLKLFFRHTEPSMRFMRNEVMNGRQAANVMGLGGSSESMQFKAALYGSPHRADYEGH